MTSYKYPYISDKNMYRAVMGACSMIRETGYFNKAVSYYADKYDVSEESLAKHIRARQSAGQKGKAKGRKYKYFVTAEIVQTCEGSASRVQKIEIIKATTAENASRRYYEADMNATKQNDTGSYYSLDFFHVLCCDKRGYSTKEEAERALIASKDDILKRYDRD